MACKHANFDHVNVNGRLDKDVRLYMMRLSARLVVLATGIMKCRKIGHLEGHLLSRCWEQVALMLAI